MEVETHYDTDLTAGRTHEITFILRHIVAVA